MSRYSLAPIVEVSGCVHGRSPSEVESSLALANTAHRVAWWALSYSGGSTRIVLVGTPNDIAWKLSGVAGWKEAERRALYHAPAEISR